MSEEAQVLKLFGIPFNVGNCLSGFVAALIVFFLVFWLSRKVEMKPNGKQNVLEWAIDFTNGIVKSAIPDEEGKKYGVLAFTLFMFIFVSNQLGLIFQVNVGGITYIKSPTASTATTLTLAFAVLLLSHLRLYGNIYSGEVLLTVIYQQLGKAAAPWTLIPAFPLEMVWQGFSVFIGSIQAYVFVTLTMVYMSQKVEKE